MAVLAIACDRATAVVNSIPAAVPASVTALTNTAVAGAAAAMISPAPQVVVRDASGRPVGGVLVRWRVVSGGGTVANSTSRTNASGVASAGGWTLGPSAGTQELEATVDGVGSVRFVAQVTAGGVVRLVRLSPASQSGTVGEPVAVPPSVRAEDQAGNPVSGVTITFSVASGGGVIEGGQQVTDVNGVATATAWVLGPTRGQQIARATAPGGATVTFAADAQAAAAANIEIVSGNAQQGTSGSPLPVPLTVRITDRFGNPVGGVTVVASPGANSGSVSPPTAATSSNGIASFIWTLGSGSTQTVTIGVQGTSLAVQFTATRVTSNFTIVVRYIDFTPNARQQLAVTRAVDKLTRAITSSSGTSQVSVPAGFCREWMPAVNETVTNLVVYARIGPIGEENVLGNASVCAFHPGTGLPALGTILLNSAVLQQFEANGLIDPLVLHEIAHLVGIGTLWRPPLIAGPPNDPFFTGPAANEQFLAVGGAAYTGNRVPVEIGRGAGSDSSHWRESVLGRELMTSALNGGVLNPFSVVSIGSLADIGYSVSYAAADPYQFNVGAMMEPSHVIDLRGDVLPSPVVAPWMVRAVWPGGNRRD